MTHLQIMQLLGWLDMSKAGWRYKNANLLLAELLDTLLSAEVFVPSDVRRQDRAVRVNP